MSTEAEKLLRRVDATGLCWEWQGARTGGYGRLSFRGRPDYTHRVVWTLLVGEIPHGMQLDHLCRNRACCNPDHLEPVTQAENLRRSPLTKQAVERRMTHCKRGHEFTPANTYVNDGKRVCRACRSQVLRAWKAKHEKRNATS